MARRRRQAKTPISTNKCATRGAEDPVTAYAEAVRDGKVVAGPHVRAACDRHLLDIEEQSKRGLKWEAPAAVHVIGFFRNRLCVDRVAGDGPIGSAGDVKPFDLLPFQVFIVGSSLFSQRMVTSRAPLPTRPSAVLTNCRSVPPHARAEFTRRTRPGTNSSRERRGAPS